MFKQLMSLRKIEEALKDNVSINLSPCPIGISTLVTIDGRQYSFLSSSLTDLFNTLSGILDKEKRDAES